MIEQLITMAVGAFIGSLFGYIASRKIYNHKNINLNITQEEFINMLNKIIEERKEASDDQ